MPFEWTLNPYRGCTHGCHYCYARRYHTQFELGADDEFASVIFVKTNFVEVLRRELERPSWTGDAASRSARRPTATSRSRATTSSRAARSRRFCDVSNAGRRRHEGPDGRARQGRAAGLSAVDGRAPSASACRASTRTCGARSSPAPRRRCNGCARCASSSTPACTPAC